MGSAAPLKTSISKAASDFVHNPKSDRIETAFLFPAILWYIVRSSEMVYRIIYQMSLASALLFVLLAMLNRNY